MPNYPIAPWLKPADTTSATEHGFALGHQTGEAIARIQQAQAQMAAEANRAQIEINLRQQNIERDSIEKQQQLEVAKAYHDQMTALKKQQLDQVEETIKSHAEMAARKYAAQSAVQNDYQSLISSNPDMKPEKAIMLATMRHAGELGGSLSGIAALGAALTKSEKAAFIPGDVQGMHVLDPDSKAPIPGMVGFPNSSGTGMDVRNTRIINPERELKLTELGTALNTIVNNKAAMGTNYGPALAAITGKFAAKAQQVNKQPESKEYEVLTKDTKPVKDTLYRSPVDNQLYLFNGKGFVKPMSPVPKDQAENDTGDGESEVAADETVDDPETVEA